MNDKISISTNYKECTLARMETVQPVVLYDLDTYGYGFVSGTPYYPVFCRTDGFNNINELTGTVEILDQSGRSVRRTTLARDWTEIWPHFPSTLFNPNGNNKIGILWVKESFFQGNEKAEISQDVPKWPKALGIKKIQIEIEELFGKSIAKFLLELGAKLKKATPASQPLDVMVISTSKVLSDD
jgi:hypothetical protein